MLVLITSWIPVVMQAGSAVATTGTWTPAAIIASSVGVATFVLSIADRIARRGKSDAQLSESVASQQKQIDSLRQLITKHDETLSSIQVTCARRISETSTTEQMRHIINEEMGKLPEMIIAQLYTQGIIKRD